MSNTDKQTWITLAVLVAIVAAGIIGAVIGYNVENQIWLSHCATVPDSFYHYVCSQP